MKTLTSLAALALLALAPVVAADVKPPAGFRALFNGKDLTGWFGLNPHNLVKLQGEKKTAKVAQERADFAKHWRVENGELVNPGTGPYANTTEELGDIELQRPRHYGNFEGEKVFVKVAARIGRKVDRRGHGPLKRSHI